MLLGIGVGLILGALILIAWSGPSKPISDAEVENRARGLGMQYPSEFKFK